MAERGAPDCRNAHCAQALGGHLNPFARTRPAAGGLPIGLRSDVHDDEACVKRLRQEAAAASTGNDERSRRLPPQWSSGGQRAVSQRGR